MNNQIDYTDALHKRENNPESEAHLKQNKFHFTGQVAFVYSLLQKGVVLTQRTAMLEYNIGDCHRRIGNLREALKKAESDFIVADQWVKDEHGKKTKFKKWFNPKAAGINTEYIIYNKQEKQIQNFTPQPKKTKKEKTLPPSIQQPFNI